MDFLHNAFAFPTAIWSVLLIFVLLYWLLVILGALDLDVLDGVLGAGDGGAEGALDGPLDGGADGGAEGLDTGHDVDGAHDGVLATVLGTLGLAGVPLTVALSVLIFLGWVLTYLGMEVWRRAGLAILGGVATGVLVAAVALALALASTSLALRPLRGAFRTQQATSRHELVGRICKLTTMRADTGFGQAEIDDGGSPVLMQVRCLRPNQLTRGAQAIVYDYDREHEVFLIAPLDSNLEDFSTRGA